ncbi:iron-sulfur cluster assembly accessory protein [Candidatus Woesearchaeota archaeon]|nr:iron-sulfur cluster assembly accessory protein [Candidatus Woesearchaeota archaeon]
MTKQLIHKDMTLGEVVEKYPQCVQVMLDYGLHCVGCHASTWETLEQGTMGHGMSDDMFQEMLQELNKTAGQTPEKKVSSTSAKETLTKETLIVTDKAAEKIVQLMKNEGKENSVLRVQVIPGGCSGMNYDLAFDEGPQEGDIVIEKYGIMICIDEESLSHMKGATIDFVDSLQGSGFKINNPETKSDCGC